MRNRDIVIGSSDDEGAPRALIETGDPGGREWVRATIDAHREQTTRLTADNPPHKLPNADWMGILTT